MYWKPGTTRSRRTMLLCFAVLMAGVCSTAAFAFAGTTQTPKLGGQLVLGQQVQLRAECGCARWVLPSHGLERLCETGCVQRAQSVTAFRWSGHNRCSCGRDATVTGRPARPLRE